GRRAAAGIRGTLRAALFLVRVGKVSQMVVTGPETRHEDEENKGCRRSHGRTLLKGGDGPALNCRDPPESVSACVFIRGRRPGGCPRAGCSPGSAARSSWPTPWLHP